MKRVQVIALVCIFFVIRQFGLNVFHFVFMVGQRGRFRRHHFDSQTQDALI